MANDKNLKYYNQKIEELRQTDEQEIAETGHSRTSIRLELLRCERALPRKQLSDDTGIGFSTLCQYECEYRQPNLVNLKILADYFGVTCDYLMGKSADREKIAQDTLKIPEGLSNKELVFITKYKNADKKMKSWIKDMLKNKELFEPQRNIKSDV